MNTASDPQPAGPLPRSIIWLMALTSFIELVLLTGDMGLFGSSHWRARAYEYGAFWAGLLHDWRPNYALQPWTMFLSYAFLHGGPGHLIGNMLALWGLARVATGYFDTRWILALYLLSAIGGGLCFGLLTRSPQPMVGASGALFGLLGAWQYMRWVIRRRSGRSMWPVLITVLWLVVLNFLLWILLDGLLAWETHLGGFLVGAIGAMVFRRMRVRTF